MIFFLIDHFNIKLLRITNALFLMSWLLTVYQGMSYMFPDKAVACIFHCCWSFCLLAAY